MKRKYHLLFGPFNFFPFSTAFYFICVRFPFPLLLYSFIFSLLHINFSRILFDSGCLPTPRCDVSRILAEIIVGEAGAGPPGSLNINHSSRSPAFLLLAFHVGRNGSSFWKS
ncbi:uncharacterized protein P174DRAFT_100050 [Aspergillus novofumigatus IBT 16806]|uniref:Uncharacterized protein n=1 Tax=Aspergillus novofumigatus (strain IBT 16806) TaxID=1392255 RepID=A0A2I1CHM7_ASPN1|nr:uncharacterized protein P174DRAFT_100050 [Aspergillus novofumigatus IBT 16806]PKX97117.1 hypothetical protein P174DRAFT_100050 [Aspergillus novofumigatus IBT 16806]